MEKYQGLKFKTWFLSRKLPSRKSIKKLVFIGKHLMRKKVNLNAMAGNLSLRQKKTFAITATNTRMDKLKEKDFVLAKKVDYKNKKVFVSGIKKPSSETLMHAMIYAKRKDINCIAHFHNALLLKKAKTLEIPITKKYYAYGTISLAKEVTKKLKKNNLIAIKRHGLLALGENEKKALENAIKITEISKKRKMLSRRQALELLRKKNPENIVRHSLKVNEIAMNIGRQLHCKKEIIDLQLLDITSLLHDLDKFKSLSKGYKYNEGVKMLYRQGYRKLAKAIENSQLDKFVTKPLEKHSIEEIIVQYADKRVKHDKVVSLNERFDYLYETYGLISPKVMKKLKKAKKIMKKIEVFLKKAGVKIK